MSNLYFKELFLKQVTKDFLHKTEKNLSASFLQTLTPPYLPQKNIKKLILQQGFPVSDSELEIDLDELFDRIQSYFHQKH